ncbi:ASCH domain-containing protein [Jonesia quinghaiensis]|uniref:ASCH domain-containing protein n=1 Tax=Jonesia quinghaiensis TaxID=262806 RepID=UPI0004157750|nr:ASCH domain-containing protein [Jonesia quinghaiensis]
MSGTTPAAPMDIAAAEAFWERYAQAHPDRMAACDSYIIDRFGDSLELNNQLMALVLAGDKTATAALVAEFTWAGEQLPVIGSHWVACDGHGAPRAILRSTELRIGPFHSCTEAFAADEGEDDRTLESWRREHQRYWTRVLARHNLAFHDDIDVVFERFEVVATA